MKTYKQEFTITRTTKLNFALHIPEEARSVPDKPWPTILFLHGRGEFGDNPEDLFLTGLPPYVAERPEFPFIVIAPQCPWKTWWPELADEIDQLLNFCLRTYPVDPRRLYLTGLSMGGFGAWYLAARWPERFAAVAPICGGGYWMHGFPEQVAALRDVPVWAFHGAKDDVVPPSFSEELVNTLKAGGGDVKLTIYPEADHDSWTETYQNPALYEWFLSHKIK